MRIFFISLLLLASLTYAAGPGDEGERASPSGAPECSVKTSCNATETCWFSLSDTADAHISDCTNDPYTYKLCCLEKYQATIRSSCNANEFDVLTYSSSTGDAHLSSVFDPYAQHVCIAPTTNDQLDCSVKLRTSATADDQCQITLSSQSDAHAASCTDPYDYGLYCTVGFTSAYAPHTFSVLLKPATLQNSLYIESVGSLNPSQVTSTTYASSYALSYLGRTMYGLASFTPNEKDTIQTDKNATAHTVGIVQPVQKARAFAIFTRADLDQVQSAMNQIDTPSDAPQVSFGYASPETMLVQVGIDISPSIDVQGTEVLSPGIYRLEIEKTGTENAIHIVKIQKD